MDNTKSYLWMSFLCQWETKVQQGEKDFEQISKTIRKEVGRFEACIIFSK